METLEEVLFFSSQVDVSNVPAGVRASLGRLGPDGLPQFAPGTSTSVTKAIEEHLQRQQASALCFAVSVSLFSRAMVGPKVVPYLMISILVQNHMLIFFSSTT